MRTETRERKIPYTAYIAEDGTEFDNENECRVYDNSAKGVLKARIREFTTHRMSEYDLFNAGGDDYELIVVHPASDADVESLLRLLNLSNNDITKAKEELTPSGDYLFWIGSECDNYDNFCYYGTCENVIKNIKHRMGIDDEDDDEE